VPEEGFQTMTNRVLLLRHAETANPLVFHGAESDVGLSERGLRQALAVAPVIAADRPDWLVSSAMRRALHTAEPIAHACGLSLQVEPLLHERKVGVLSGTSNQDPEGPNVRAFERWMAGDTGYAPEGAESYDDLRARVLPVWERLTSCPGQTLVIVAHGMVIRTVLLGILPGLGLAGWHRLGKIPNVGITELIREAGVWQALRISEVPEAARLL
jgi:broad specificity phosphatase PhoE